MADLSQIIIPVKNESTGEITEQTFNFKGDATSYSTGDSASTTINNTDYIPMSTSNGSRKKALWTTIINKIKSVFGSAAYTSKTDYPMLNGGATEIPASSTNTVDLNTYITPGNYVCVSDSNSIYITNQPLTDSSLPGFNLLVMKSKNNSSYYRQIIIYYNRNDCIYTRRTVDNGVTWSEWISLIYDSSKVLKTGDTMTGNLTIDRSGTATTQEFSIFTAGNNIAVGTAGNQTGVIRLYSKDDHYIDLRAKDSASADNVYLELPLTNGTLAITSQVEEMVSKSGDTVTGTLILSKTTNASGTANNKPALIVGGTDTSTHLELDGNEIMAKGSGTTTAALYINNDGGDVYINGKYAARHTTAATNGQVMIADGTAGGIKTSGYTIAKSVPSDANFANTTYTFATGDNNGQIKVTPSGGSAQNVSVKGLGDRAYDSTEYVPKAGGAFTGNVTAPYLRIKNTDGGMSINCNNEDGTTSTIGKSQLVLGNNIASGNARNSAGSISIYSQKTSYIQLLAQDVDSARYLYLPSSGTALATSSSSSYRVKENIRNISEEEAKKILDVNVVKFDYKEGFEDGKKNQSGVIAEEVIKIIPEVVTVHEAYDESKPIDPASNPSPTVDYGKFAPYLIKMVQMQQERIEKLERLVDELRR